MWQRRVFIAAQPHLLLPVLLFYSSFWNYNDCASVGSSLVFSRDEKQSETRLNYAVFLEFDFECRAFFKKIFTIYRIIVIFLYWIRTYYIFQMCFLKIFLKIILFILSKVYKLSLYSNSEEIRRNFRIRLFAIKIEWKFENFKVIQNSRTILKKLNDFLDQNIFSRIFAMEW